MRRGFVCLLVAGLAGVSLAADAAPDNVGSETQDVASKVAGPAINFKYLDKNKRGAVKLTNADAPSFNHLGSSGAASGSAASGGGDFKPSAGNPGLSPFRYLYNNQYYQPNPYLTYVQIPQAAQIAAQYAFQANPVAHFLQTPTQIQYVAAPTVAQVPQIKYQAFGREFSAAESSASAASASQYVPQAQQSSGQYVSQAQVHSSSGQYVPQAQQASASQSFSSGASGGQSAASTAGQAKQVQVPLYSGYQTPQQPIYFQQPYFYLTTPNLVYQQPASSILLKQQQQQQQIASLYGGHRFGVFNPGQNAQLTYLLPSSLAATASVQGSTSAASDAKSSGKTATATATQQPASGNSFSYGTKA